MTKRERISADRKKPRGLNRHGKQKYSQAYFITMERYCQVLLGGF